MGVSEGICNHSYSTSDRQCDRPVWGNHGQCIWHADEGDKPTEELRAARKDGPENLDDCILTDVTFEEPISFEDCSMRNATLVRSKFEGSNFSGADLSDAALFNASMAGASLIRTELRNAILNSADLTNIDAIYADFSDCKGWELNLSGADLRNVKATGAVLPKSTLEETSFHQSNLKSIDLREADLEDAELNWADLRGADLRQANMTHADLYGAKFDWANLERAFLSDAVLLETSLIGARIGSTVFEGVQVDTETKFGERCIYDPAFEEEPGPGVGDHHFEAVDDTVENARRAAETYGALEELARENALPEQASTYFVLRKDLLRLEHKKAGRWGLWIRGWMSNLVVEYGESPWRVVGTTAVAVAICGLLFPVYGFRNGSGVVTYSSPDISLVDTLFESMYFSIVTFTTLGYGDVQPIGFSRTIATAETIAGSALLALLVFVFGRRATR